MNVNQLYPHRCNILAGFVCVALIQLITCLPVGAEEGAPTLHLEGTVITKDFNMDGNLSDEPTPHTFTASVSGFRWTVLLTGNTNLVGGRTIISCDGTNVYAFIPETDGRYMIGNSLVPVTHEGAVYPGRVAQFPHGIMGAVWWGYCSSSVIGTTNGFVPDVLNLLIRLPERGPISGKVFAKFGASSRLSRYFGPVQTTFYSTNSETGGDVLAAIDPVASCEREGFTVETNYIITRYYPNRSPDSKPHPFGQWVVMINTFYPETNYVSFTPKFIGLAHIRDFRQPYSGEYLADHWLTEGERSSTQKTPVLPLTVSDPPKYIGLKKLVLLVLIIFPLAIIGLLQIRRS
jgi:hypothetical protein